MLPSILCFANSRDHAEQIVDRLQADNVPLADIAVLVQPLGETQPEPIKDLGYAGGAVGTDEKTEAGTATGGVVGAAAGVAVLGNVGLTPLLMIAPAVVGAGAVAGAAIGAAVTAANSELSAFGIAPSRMNYYQQRMLQGGFLVAVRTEDENELDRAKNVFKQTGGQDVETFRLTKKLT